MNQNDLSFEMKLVQERLTAAVAVVGFGVWDWDVAADRLIWDEQMFRIFGVARDDFHGTVVDWSNALLPEDRERALNDVQRALAGEKEFDTEFSIRRALDGAIRLIRAKATVLRDENGKPIRLVGCNWDVTDQRQAEYQANAMLRLVEASRDLYAIFSMDGKQTYMNAAAENFWKQMGRSPRVLQEWFEPEFGGEFTAQGWPALIQGQGWEKEVDFWRPGAKEAAYYWFRAFTIADGAGFSVDGKKLIALIGTDITERRRVEAKLIHASKMATLGEMAGGIAHEINNPLGVILVRSQLLSRKVISGSASPMGCIEDLKKIEETSLRIAKIVQALRTFSKDSTDEPIVEVPLIQVIDDTLDLCGERIKSQNVDVRVNVPAHMKIRCRPAQISEVLLNLIQNAFDAVGGKPDAWIEIACSDPVGPNDHLELTVTDSGTGIPESVTRRMMEPFFTTKEVNQGTGLGLSVSKGIIESHGGELKYDPSFLHTRFIVELPKAG